MKRMPDDWHSPTKRVLKLNLRSVNDEELSNLYHDEKITMSPTANWKLRKPSTEQSSANKLPELKVSPNFHKEITKPESEGLSPIRHKR